MTKSKYGYALRFVFALAIYSVFICNAFPQTPELRTPKKEGRLSPKDPDVLENDLLGRVSYTRESYFVPELKFEIWELGKPFMTLSENYDPEGYYTSSILRVYRAVETIADKAFRELDNHYFSASGNTRISILNFKYDYANKIIFKDRKVSDSPTDDESKMQIYNPQLNTQKEQRQNSTKTAILNGRRS